MKPISSKGNSRYRHWKDILQGSELKKSADYIVMGKKLVPEYIEKHLDDLSEIIINEPEDLDYLPAVSHNKVYLVEKNLFKQIDIMGTHFPLAVFTQPKIFNWDIQKPPNGLEVFSALQDPSNLGALTRVAEGFGVKKIILLKESSHPFHPKSVRASSGSCHRVKFEWGPSINENLGDCIILDSEGKNINEFTWPKEVRLLIGEEGRGIPFNHKSKNSIRIPIDHNLESLNAVSAASIAIYDFFRNHGL